jgi:hypothetical protein
MPRYFITNNYSLAFIPKSGCSTLARSVIASFQEDEEQSIQNAHYPDGRGPDSSQWQWLAKTEDSPSKPVLAFIRHPVDRFLSAMVQLGQESIDLVVSSMLAKETLQGPRGRAFKPHINPHFLPQILWVTPTAKLYRFPDHLQEGAEEAGLGWPLPVINSARRPKPMPTQSQADQILYYYEEDLALYESISEPGITTGMVAQKNYEIPNRPNGLVLPGMIVQPW